MAAVITFLPDALYQRFFCGKTVFLYPANIFFCFLFYDRAFGVRAVSLNAEWAPPGGAKWVEKDFEAEMKKLEKEAADRLDAKIQELETNVMNAGKSK